MKTTNKKNMKRKKLKNLLFTPLFFVATNIYLEIVFHIYAYRNVRLIYPILLSIPVGVLMGAIVDLFREKTARVLRYVCIAAAFLAFSVQAVYYHVFKDLMTFAMIGMAGEVAENFLGDALIGIWETVPMLLLFALPFPVLWFFQKRLQIKNKPYLKKTVAVLISYAAVLIVSLIALPIGGTKAHSAFDLYYNNWDISLAGPKLGITTTTLLDIKRVILNKDDKPDTPTFHDVTLPDDSDDTDLPVDTGDVTEIGTDSEGEPIVIDTNPYNSILELDFDALAKKTDNEDYKTIFKYLASQKPTKKNDYTGMFKGYNLIMICAESFSPVCISEKYTPTLYMLSHSGFEFKNYWTSFPSVTTNGEYSFLTGLFPDFEKEKKDGSFLYTAKNGNTMNQTIASWFKAQGIQPIAYHPNTGTYYSRNLTHPNLGYVLHAQEDYPALTGWPESDLTLVQSSIGEYINSDRFLTYIMSVSGHHNYKFGGYNDICDKNKAIVEDADLAALGMNFDLTNSDQAEEAEHAKAYIAANIELDRALEYLIEQLRANGTLDKTVICLTADHYPYGLEDSEYARMLGYSKPSSMKYDRLERYKNTLIIWNSAMKHVEVTKPCCTVDILPTLLNLFGFKFDSRLYSGKDILSDSYGLAMLKDQSFITDKIVYNSRYDLTYKLDKSFTVEDSYTEAYMQEVSNRFAIAKAILNCDFYKALPQDVIATAQSVQ
ncbi:MAG: sulfatase-like hydrolase/transferase [Firmicutes bacterium]|nr:sulfatase-like hydrolase/transferase [Candidatus Colimorpha enterica]